MRIDAWWAFAAVLGLIVLSMPAFREPGEYYGSEIYSLALDYPSIANRTVLVEGVLAGSGEAVSIEGRVSGAGRGYVLVESGGREYRVGGPLAGREDIAARKLRILP